MVQQKDRILGETDWFVIDIAEKNHKVNINMFPLFF